MSSTPTYPLCINQYATFTLSLIWTTSPCGCATVGASFGPVDLTGYTASMQIRPFPAGPILFDASTDIVLGGTAGTITVTIPAASTATFTWFTGVYDLILTSATGVVTRFLEGSVTVSAGVTP